MEIFKVSKSLGFKEKLTEINICDLALLQKWLREEKGIDVFVQRDVNRTGYEYLIEDDLEFNHEATEAFNTYEEALETGLFESLKLI